MTWTLYGPQALLFRFAERLGDETYERGRALVAELDQHPPPGLVDLVPAFTTLLLEFDPQQVPDVRALAPGLAVRLERAAGAAAPPAPVKHIPVTYDGPDLERVAREHGMTPREVGELHAAPVYKVYMLGFAPGFPYLGDLDPRLHMPRLASPRSRVSAGSVAIGGAHTGIYSVDSPGGWNLIGRTPAKLFDPEQAVETMFLLRAGDRVKFVAET